MEMDREALRAAARELEILRDALVKRDAIDKDEAAIITRALEEIGQATGDGDLATSASVAEFQPRD